MSSPPTHLSRQVEEIARSAGDDAVDVFVQMANRDNEVRTVILRGAKQAQTRLSSISARDLIPPPASQLPKDVIAPSRLARKPAAGTSFKRRAPPAHNVSEARASGDTALAPLKSWVQRGTENGGVPLYLPTSGAAALTLTSADAKRLVSEVEGVAAIYRNRRVSKPPVARSSEEIAAVRDNLAHTWGVARTGAMACWGAFGARGKGIKVAVLDTGVDAQHPDLKGKVHAYAEFDRAGKVVRESLRQARDEDGHGTHVCGTIAGGNASGRWIGMAPEATLLVGRVLPPEGSSDRQILAGMQWALDRGADLINLSLGATALSPSEIMENYTNMIVNANALGVPVVIAVGNDGAQTSGSPGNDFYSLTVGATDSDDLAAGFSGGRTQVIEQSRYLDPADLPLLYSKPDLSAPGVAVYSAMPGKRWQTLSGTSMATPHVSGAIAILLSGLPVLRQIRGFDRVNVIQQLLISSVKELGESGQNHRFGFGRLDVLRAMGFGLQGGYGPPAPRRAGNRSAG